MPHGSSTGSIRLIELLGEAGWAAAAGPALLVVVVVVVVEDWPWAGLGTFR